MTDEQMINTPPLVRVVDDDEDLLEALAFMLRSEGWTVKTYSGAAAFFAYDDASVPGCVILDYSMPRMNGLEMQKRLRDLDYPHPLIFLTAHADVDMAISAFKRGANDLLRKPVTPTALFSAVAQAVQKDLQTDEGVLHAAERFKLLTDREAQILNLANLGLMNRQIAERLGLSERTVESHRANGYRKLGVKTLAELAMFMTTLKRDSRSP